MFLWRVGKLDIFFFSQEFDTHSPLRWRWIQESTIKASSINHQSTAFMNFFTSPSLMSLLPASNFVAHETTLKKASLKQNLSYWTSLKISKINTRRNKETGSSRKEGTNCFLSYLFFIRCHWWVLFRPSILVSSPTDCCQIFWTFTAFCDWNHHIQGGSSLGCWRETRRSTQEKTTRELVYR